MLSLAPPSPTHEPTRGSAPPSLLFAPLLHDLYERVHQLEANNNAMQAALHTELGGSFGSGRCDRNGCFSRIGGPTAPGHLQSAYGPGKQVDSMRPFEVQASVDHDGGLKVALSQGGEDTNRQIEDLKGCLLQRDNEIAILVNMIKKGKNSEHVSEAVSQSREGRLGRSSMAHYDSMGTLAAPRGAQPSFTADEKPDGDGFYRGGEGGQNAMQDIERNAQQHLQSQQQQEANGEAKDSLWRPEREAFVDATARREQERTERIVERHLFGVAPPDDQAQAATLMDDPARAFEYFRERVSLSAGLEENKALLKVKYEEAKALGEKANNSRNSITYLKSSIEALRREAALAGRVIEGKDDDAVSQEEATHRRAIEEEKVVYKTSFDALRILKPEIEHIRKILEKGRATLQSHFDQWFDALFKRDGRLPGPKAHTSMYAGAHDNTSGRRAEQKFESRPAEASKASVDDDIAAFQRAKEELMRKRRTGT